MGDLNETTHEETKHTPKLNPEQAWAQAQSAKRHNELIERNEAMAANMAHVSTFVQDIKTDTAAILEAVAPTKPTNFIDAVIFKMDDAVSAVWKRARPFVALAAIGYAGAKGVGALRARSAAKKAAKAAAAVVPA